MRICTPEGKVCKVDKAVPYVEKKESFNGTIHMNREAARSFKFKPTCLQFQVVNTDKPFFRAECTVGNLPCEKVKEILKVLLKDGFYDFSEMEYQKQTVSYGDLVIDGGKSLPYYSEDIDVGFCGGGFPVFGMNNPENFNVPSSEESEDTEDFDDSEESEDSEERSESRYRY